MPSHPDSEHALSTRPVRRGAAPEGGVRAAFLIGQIGEGWVGGVNYFRNLFAALAELPERTVQPVLVLGRKAEAKFYKEFDWVEIVRTPMLDRLHPAWILRKLLEAGTRRDLLLTPLLNRNGIRFQSHLFSIGSKQAVPAAGWIPDFQHRHLPEFFAGKTLKTLDHLFHRIATYCNAVILSSNDALKDLVEIEPRSAGKARVLHFVANVPSAENVPSPASLAEKYQLRGPYFHLPNQFWAHKNHIVVVEALHILKQRGHSIQVLATGNPKDNRQPDHFEKLMGKARELGVADKEFRVLGLVPFPDLVGIMGNSIALINPSLFEGWSTTVEEAKSLGKRMILSNLAVHREQNPPGGLYFDPKNPNELADRLIQASSDTQFDAAALREKARLEFPERRREFARQYCRLVQDVLAK